MAWRLGLRIGSLLATSICVVLLAFVVQFVIPGDPARSLVPRGNKASIAQIRKDLHLDRPITVQFEDYVGGLLHGNLGRSYVRNESVTSLILRRLPDTAILALAGVIVQLLVGVLLGVWAAATRLGARVVPVFTMSLLVVPSFVLGLALLLVFGYELGWAPVVGGDGPSDLVLPAITLGLLSVPLYAQIVSETTTESLASDYARTAVAKGVPSSRIVRRHTLRNVASPVVTLIGLDLGQYLAGVVFIEAVFGWPGIGELAVSSLNQLDRPVVLGVALVVALAVGVFNLAADLVRLWLDPRTRAQGL